MRIDTSLSVEVKQRRVYVVYAWMGDQVALKFTILHFSTMFSMQSVS